MGCDITIHAEVFDNGKWVYFGKYSMDRSGYMFGLMSSTYASIYKPSDIQFSFPTKGMPSNMSKEMKEVYKKQTGQSLNSKNSCVYPQVFGDSYLTQDEIEKINKKSKYNSLFDYIRSTESLDFDKYNKYRLIFWFDN